MSGTIRAGLAALLITGLASTAAFPAAAEDMPVRYEVKITNVTSGHATDSGILFTPFIVAAHQAGLKIFRLGERASTAIERIAEGGDFGLLDTELSEDPRVQDIAKGDAALLPGQSVTFELATRGSANHISLVAMLLPTNDGMVALVDVPAPTGKDMETYYALGYDGGTETNSESCADIPGPHCMGTAFSPGDTGEGYVHVHAGIRGIGDLDPAKFDWRNPVAVVQIARLSP